MHSACAAVRDALRASKSLASIPSQQHNLPSASSAHQPGHCSHPVRATTCRTHPHSGIGLHFKAPGSSSCHEVTGTLAVASVIGWSSFVLPACTKLKGTLRVRINAFLSRSATPSPLSCRNFGCDAPSLNRETAPAWVSRTCHRTIERRRTLVPSYCIAAMVLQVIADAVTASTERNKSHAPYC